MRPAASRVKTAGGSGGGGPWMTTGRSAEAGAAGGCAAAAWAAAHGSGSARASGSHQRAGCRRRRSRPLPGRMRSVGCLPVLQSDGAAPRAPGGNLDGAAPQAPGVRLRGPLRPAPLPPKARRARLAEAAPFSWRRLLAQVAVERPQLVAEQLRLLQRGEVSAALHVREPLDVVARLRPAPRTEAELPGKTVQPVGTSTRSVGGTYGGSGMCWPS